MMSRRTLLFSAAAAVPLLAAWRFARSTDESAMIAILYKRLSFLNLDKDGVQAFAGDAVAANFTRGPKLRLIAALGPLYRDFPMTGSNFLDNAIHHGEERVISQYLLSTDFFTNGADETKIVRYLGYYDPVRRPRACGNPFARFA